MRAGISPSPHQIRFWVCVAILAPANRVQAKEDLLRELTEEIREKDVDIAEAMEKLEVRKKKNQQSKTTNKCEKTGTKFFVRR